MLQRYNKPPKTKTGFYLSGQMLTKDHYIANKLAKGFLGTNHVDTNSRKLYGQCSAAYKRPVGADFVPFRMVVIFKSYYSFWQEPPDKPSAMGDREVGGLSTMFGGTFRL